MEVINVTDQEAITRRQSMVGSATGARAIKLRLGRAPEGIVWGEVCKRCSARFTTVWLIRSYCQRCNDHTNRQPAATETKPYRVPHEFREYGIEDAVLDAATEHCLLVITGPVGSGKTTQLHHLLAHGSTRSSDHRWQPVSTLATDMRENSADIMDARELALDDLGRRLTEAGIEALRNLLDHRTASGMPTYISTNLTQAEVDQLDERLGSRLAAACWLVLDREDYRRKGPAKGPA